MRIATLSSGSSGNAIFVGSEKRNILVDAGIALKKIEAGLDAIDLKISDLDGIFISHEHADHIGGLGVLLRKYIVPVYLTEGTYTSMMERHMLGNVPNEAFNIIKPGANISFGDMNIRPIKVSHDAADPVIYRFDEAEKSFAAVTDLGESNETLEKELCGLSAMLLEANHDVRMLLAGPYPYALKQRIRSNIGHLSNEDAGKLLLKLNNERLDTVMLGHISKTNNYADLAIEAVKLELGFAANETSSCGMPKIIAAPPDKISEVIEI